MPHSSASAIGAEPVHRYLGSVVESLRHNPSVSSIVLIGSFARGDSAPLSDIDLVVVTKTAVSGRLLAAALPQSELKRSLALLPSSELSFKVKYRRGDRFLRNVVEDGKVLYDDGFYEGLLREPFPDSRLSSVREIEDAKRYLSLFASPTVFNRRYMHCLPVLRFLSIKVIMAAVELAGRHDSSKRAAVQRFVELYPSHEAEARRLSSPEGYGSDSTASMSEATRAIASLKRLVDAVEEREALGSARNDIGRA
jgi:predicted nucleotidyltransferase